MVEDQVSSAQEATYLRQHEQKQSARKGILAYSGLVLTFPMSTAEQEG